MFSGAGLGRTQHGQERPTQGPALVPTTEAGNGQVCKARVLKNECVRQLRTESCAVTSGFPSCLGKTWI